jgi:hypothetical protein
VTKEETLRRAAEHLAAGRKIIISRRTPLPVGFVLRTWLADGPDEVVDDQPLVVAREATYAEFVAERPAWFGPLLLAPRAAHKYYFYEMICE